MAGRRLLIALGGAFCLVILVRTAWLSELSYLTLRTIEHAANGYGLRWNINERVQAFDHPLWMLLLLGGRLLIGESYYTTLVLSLTVSAATVVLVLSSAGGPAGVVLGAVLLSMSWSFVTFSTSGLEGPLAHLLIVLFCLAWLAPNRARGSGRAAALAGAAGVTHPATLLVTIPALAAATRGRDGTDHPTQVGRYGAPVRQLWLRAFAPIFAWGMFAAFYYGTALPTPVVAEWTERAGLLDRVHAAGRLLAYMLRSDPLTLAVVVTGIALAWRRRGQEHRGLATGLALYILVLVFWAGDGMPGRWLALPFVITTLLIVRHPGVERPATLGAAVAVALALAAAPPLATIRSDVRFGTAAERSGHRDPRANDFPATGLLHDIRQWYPPTHPEAKRGSVGWQDSNRVKTSPHPAFFGFAAGHGVHVIDVAGRTDPLLARTPPAGPAVFPAGASREIPRGYEASLPNRANAIASPALAAYYGRVRLVTRGSLLDPWRLVAAARLALERPPPTHRDGQPQGRDSRDGPPDRLRQGYGGPPKRSAKAEGGRYREARVR
jgi:arabinofuranosyltransferase